MDENKRKVIKSDVIMRLLICYKGVFMGRESNVVNFYVLCNKLKDIVRTGWGIWGVDRFRIESIAEHIYGVQMLAIAM